MKLCTCLFALCCLFTTLNAQNVGIGTLIPQYKFTVKDSTGSSGYKGFAQVSTDGKTAVGTYVQNRSAFIQTHTNDNLYFATNNGSASLTLDTLNNFGIGTETPTERLDVVGNENISGQLKFAGDQGVAGQVLMKNNLNSPEWVDLSSYKYLAVYNCLTVATSAGANNANYVWTVPAGVTSIYLEAWSGGGGASTMNGGGGGGYMSFQASVTPGNSVNLVVGAGGLNGNTALNSVPGGITSVVIGTGNCSITGGQGGFSGDVTANNFAANSSSGGGGLSSGGGLNNHIISSYGGAGKPTLVTFLQVSATEFARLIRYGDGGDAAMFPNTAAKGGSRLLSTSYSQAVYAGYGGSQGAGGASDSSGGRVGQGGLIIIHY